MNRFILIRDQLVSPPTSLQSFRDLTLYACASLHPDAILIESDDPDPYWRWIRPRGGMDFVEDFVPIGREDGVRIDTEPNFPNSVVTDRIVPENLLRLLGSIARIMPKGDRFDLSTELRRREYDV